MFVCYQWSTRVCVGLVLILHLFLCTDKEIKVQTRMHDLAMITRAKRFQSLNAKFFLH